MYYIDEDGNLNSHCHSEFWKLRYFKGELKGQDQFLKYLSQHIKSNSEEFARLLAAFGKFRAEAEHRQMKEFLSCFDELDEGGRKKMDRKNRCSVQQELFKKKMQVP